MIEYKFEIPFGDQPNANGRIYPKELVKKMVEEMNNKQFPITTEKTEFDANKPFDNKEIIGVTTSAVHHDDNRVVVECKVNDDTLYEHLKLGVDIVPNGVGNLKETGEVTDYQLKFFSITGNSAFKKETE